jgi:hypothetical protein
MRRPTADSARTASRLAAVLAALGALAGAVLVLGATPASAGGPTSVLVVNYDGSRAAAALTGSRTYEDLGTALDVFSGEQPSGEASAPADFMGTELRLTWLVHDVVPWRLDALRLDGEHIWVNTVVSWEGDLFDQPGVWHRPADQALLRATLTSMGVLGPAVSESNSPTSRAGRPTAALTTAGTAPAAPAESVARGSAPGADPDSRPVWAMAGTALVGLVIGWSGHRFTRRRAARQADDHAGDPLPKGAEAEGPAHLPPPAAQTGRAAYRHDDPVSRFTLR